MAQHDLDIANQVGFSFRGDLNNLIAALVTGMSGATAPTNTFPYMFWNDTGSNKVKQRNAADSAWEELGSLFTKAPEIQIVTDKIALKFPSLGFQICGNKVTTGSIIYATGPIYRSSEVGFNWVNAFNSTPFAVPMVMQGSDNAWAALGQTSISSTAGSVRAMCSVSTSIALIAIIGIGTYTP